MHALPTGLRNAARSRKHSHSNWICFRQDLQRRAACVTFPGSAGFDADGLGLREEHNGPQSRRGEC